MARPKKASPTIPNLESTIPHIDPFAEKRPKAQFRFVDVCIMGTRPMLMHRFGETAEAAVQSGIRRQKKDRKTPREEALEGAYFDHKSNLVFPGAAISKLLKSQGTSHKQKSSRKSVGYIVPAAVLVVPRFDTAAGVEDEYITLHDAKREPLTKFEVDSRRVVIKATKGSIMRHRPRLDMWFASFTLRINENVLDEETIYQLLAEAGETNGLGDYRPECGGPFGMFQVRQWVPAVEEVDLAAE